VLSKNLAVKRVGISYHLSIQYQSGNPNRAAQIANAIAGAYITEQLEGKYDSTKRAVQWMRGRIEELNQKQALAERRWLILRTKQHDHGRRQARE
jgi:polysaccharide biosynthesis transport protein